MAQVKRVFAQKKVEMGARRAADELNVCLASYYKYLSGEVLPSMEVLKIAQEKWEVEWELIDVSKITTPRKISSPEQYLLFSLQELRAEDVEVASVRPIGPKRDSALQVTLKIRFPA